MLIQSAEKVKTTRRAGVENTSGIILPFSGSTNGAGAYGVANRSVKNLLHNQHEDEHGEMSSCICRSLASELTSSSSTSHCNT